MELRQNLQQSFFSERIKQVPRSFLRDILQVAVSKNVISFAGGLPNKKYFPNEELKQSAIRLLSKDSGDVLQYSNTEGFLPLRQYISDYYAKRHILVGTRNILITTGSQQALDLLGKSLINKGDSVILEEPSYLGAIQAFSVFQPEFSCVPLLTDGLDISKLEETILKTDAKLAYIIPNFQNPSGISYSEDIRMKVAKLATLYNVLLIEDDPYGEIRFSGEPKKSLYSYAPNNTILLGTFSKTIAPGLRVGWIVAPDEIMEKLIIAKQAADLHTDIFAQQLVFDYLTNNPIEEHLKLVRDAYRIQAQTMMDAIEQLFPKEASCTRPEGGMFMWVTMPDKFSTLKLFDLAIRKNVAFVPGFPFFINRPDSNCMRLNFSCSNPDEIYEGIKRIALCFLELC